MHGLLFVHEFLKCNEFIATLQYMLSPTRLPKKGPPQSNVQSYIVVSMHNWTSFWVQLK